MNSLWAFLNENILYIYNSYTNLNIVRNWLKNTDNVLIFKFDNLLFHLNIKTNHKNFKVGLNKNKYFI